MRPMQLRPVTATQFVALWLAALGMAFVTSALLRKAKGLPFFQPKFTDVEARQSWISGASSRGLFGRFTVLNNAMWVVLTRDVLHVGAHFPFNMLMPTILTRFDLDIPVAAISSIEEKSSLFGVQWLRVTYDVKGPTERKATAYVDLRPRRGDRFAEVLREKVRAARPRI